MFPRAQALPGLCKIEFLPEKMLWVIWLIFVPLGFLFKEEHDGD